MTDESAPSDRIPDQADPNRGPAEPSLDVAAADSTADTAVDPMAELAVDTAVDTATDPATAATDPAADSAGPSPIPAGRRPSRSPGGAAQERVPRGATRATPAAENAGAGAEAAEDTAATAADTTATAASTAASSSATADTSTATADPADPVPEKVKLLRGGGRDKALAGVCHGAGRYFDVDPVIFRVVLVVLSLTGGIGLIIYGMGWLVIPQEGEQESEAHRLLSGRIEGAPLTAVLMALVGCGLYASMLGNGANQAFSLILLAATAGAVYWSQQRGRMQATGEAASVAASAVADAPPAAQAPPEPGAKPSWWRDPLTKDPSYLWGPDDGPYGEEDRRAWRERKKAVRRKREWAFSLVVLLLTVTALAVGTGVSWQYQPVGVSLEIGLSAALGVLGFAFVIASFAGRAREGTAFWSIVMIAGLIVAASLPKSGQGVGETTWQPLTASAVQGPYERGAGTGTLDLRAIRLGGATVSARLKVGAGKAVVILPKTATTHIVYNLGIGEVDLPGKVHNGVRIRNSRQDRLTFGPAPGTPSSGNVELDLNVGVGQLEVIR
jgi:phage shock protein PspC (stress-responsive transcriptional regulator)